MACTARGPFEAKEIGEGSLLPMLGAIATAIYGAREVRVTELPIIPKRILNGLKGRGPLTSAHLLAPSCWIEVA